MSKTFKSSSGTLSVGQTTGMTGAMAARRSTHKEIAGQYASGRAYSPQKAAYAPLAPPWDCMVLGGDTRPGCTACLRGAAVLESRWCGRATDDCSRVEKQHSPQFLRLRIVPLSTQRHFASAVGDACRFRGRANSCGSARGRFGPAGKRVQHRCAAFSCDSGRVPVQPCVTGLPANSSLPTTSPHPW